MNWIRFSKTLFALAALGILAGSANANWNFDPVSFEYAPKSSITVDSNGKYVMAFTTGSPSRVVKLRYYGGSGYADVTIVTVLDPYVIDAVSVAISPGSPDTICVAYTDNASSADALHFSYVSGYVSGGTWYPSSPVSLEYPKYGSGDPTTNAWTWFDPGSCDTEDYDPACSFPHDIYGCYDDDEPEDVGAYSLVSTIQVENVGGLFWFACGAGTIIFHSTNPTAYRFEQHSAFYLIAEEVGGDFENASAATREYCESQNQYWPAPFVLDGNLGGDPAAASTDDWHLTYPPVWNSSGSSYLSGNSGYANLFITLDSNSTLPKVVVRNDMLYAVYRASSKVWYRKADLTAGTPTWTSPTQIGSTGHYVACIGASEDGADLYTAILYGLSEPSAHLYKNTAYEDQIAPKTRGYGDRLAVTGTTSEYKHMLVDYKIPGLFGGGTFYTAVATE